MNYFIYLKIHFIKISIVEASAMKPQQIIKFQLNDTFFDDNTHPDYIDIKKQIVKQLYSEYDPAIFQIILNTLGCETLQPEYCQTFLDVIKINYVIEDASVKHYIGQGKRENKELIHSENVTIINNSTEKQYLIPCEGWNVTQEFEVAIMETDQLLTNIYSNTNMTISFTADKPLNFKTFNKKSSVWANLNQSIVLDYSSFDKSQFVTLEPQTQMNVTCNRFQYFEMNYYWMDFIIDENFATITYPAFNGKVYFEKINLNNFLNTHIEFVKTMKHIFPRSIQLGVTTKTSGSKTVNVFKLKNFPAIEKIKNFAFETELSDPEAIETSTDSSTELPTTPPSEAMISPAVLSIQPKLRVFRKFRH